MNPRTILVWWPVLAAIAGGIWWAATLQAEVDGLQSYISSTASHLNNLDYNLHATGN